jgi:hypothetical protein
VAFVDLAERICWRQRCSAENARPGSLYATKRGHASTATQPESFLSQLIPQIDRSLRKSLDQRRCQGRLWEGSKQSACITSNANPSVSPWFEQFPL